MKTHYAFTAYAVLLAALLSAATSASAAGAFYLTTQVTRQNDELGPVATVMADVIRRDGKYLGSWGQKDPNMPSIKDGDRVGFLLASAIKTVVRKNGRDADRFLGQNGIRTEWYRPCAEGDIPYRYAGDQRSVAFNNAQRLQPVDPSDGNSAVRAVFGPGQTCWNAYEVGSNIKSFWMRFVNGATDRAVRDWLFGLVTTANVHHNDLWIQIHLVFVVEPLDSVQPSDQEMPPSQPAAEASNGANGQVGVSRESGIAADQNENNQRLKMGAETASAQALAVNADLQAFKKWLVENNVTPENIAAIVAYVNGHNVRLDTLEGRVAALEAWHLVVGNGGSNDQPAVQPPPVPVPTCVDYRVVFVASASKVATWEVGDVGEIAEPIVNVRVYVKYQDKAGRWVSGQFLKPGTDLWWHGATTGSARTVGVALKPTTSDGSWIHREWFVPAQPGRIVVVPVPAN